MRVWLRLRDYILSEWQGFIAYGLLFITLITVMLWKLNSLVPGYSQTEVQSYTSSLHLSKLLSDPLNAPFFLITRAFLYVHPGSYLAVRLASVSIGILILISFAWLLTSWQGMRTAIVGTLLLGLSSWFLQNSRLGVPEVLYFGVFLLAACGFWLKKTGSIVALATCFIVGTVLLYVPGMIWFILIGTAWQWRVIDSAFKKHLLSVSIATLLFMAAITPLAVALYKYHDLIRPYLGLPAIWPTPIRALENLGDIPRDLFIRNSANASTWLGTAPILDAFSIVMLLLGGYLYLRNIRLIRTPIFISIFLAALFLIAVGSPVTLSTVMPFIYVLIACGVSYFIGMWLKVFPRNPIAIGIGWSLLNALLVLVFIYHLKHYFIAWPQSEATHIAFTHIKP